LLDTSQYLFQILHERFLVTVLRRSETSNRLNGISNIDGSKKSVQALDTVDVIEEVNLTLHVRFDIEQSVVQRVELLRLAMLACH
jgi:hypothetical protein